MHRLLLIVLFFLILTGTGCKEKGYPKPGNLISEKQMVDILYDIHMSEAIADKFRYQTADSLRLEPNDLYQGVLDKYNLNDSVLAQSLIYYSSRPKIYEKIYEQVIERMNVQQEAMKKHEDMKVMEKE